MKHYNLELTKEQLLALTSHLGYRQCDFIELHQNEDFLILFQVYRMLQSICENNDIEEIT
jgi:uncharacterized protein YunC (DUF1805 family)